MIVILDCKDTTHEPKSYHATRCNISPLNSNITLYKSPVLQSITAHVAKHSFLQRYISTLYVTSNRYSTFDISQHHISVKRVYEREPPGSFNIFPLNVNAHHSPSL